MAINICCLRCKNTYSIGVQTVKIHGPLLKTTCPLCKQETTQNFSAFLRDQMHVDKENKLTHAVNMISLGRAISKAINERE